MDPEEFQATLVAARAGEGSALGDLFRELHPRILRYLTALERSEAEDLASDTWLDVARALDRFVGDERALRALAFTIARRRLIDLRRTRARRSTVPSEPAVLEAHAPLGDVEAEAMSEIAVRDATERVKAVLTPDQAEVVLLRVLGDLSVREVAAILGKRPGTVRVIQHRALRRLAQLVANERVTG